MSAPVKHVWFDLDGTLTVHTPEFHEAHNQLRYETYAKVVKRPVGGALKAEFEELYKKHGSNSAVFRSLGLPSDYWQHYFNSLDETKYFKPSQEINDTLKQLKQIVPISVFTNVKLERLTATLKAIEIDPAWFTVLLTGDDIKERKPALDGFHLMIERSKLPPENLLYVGDRVDVDVKPAKAVGIQTCLLYSSSPEADYCFMSFKDILSVFENRS
ncbi:MAG TPA: HAD family hydrolase [Candidatus Limnocylindria bacterium]|nr:HAD family hydrolase [Candidatus Limnocylindria bacterium]